MEVHHHSHSARKKWTHYFWEFFMLFLAVSAGFLVENQREHYVEHQRAKVYAANLYEELKTDTADLTQSIEKIKLVAGKLDTFCLLSRGQIQTKLTNGMLYYYTAYTTWINFFSSNNTTIDELKGSGNLRIMNSEVANKISQYSKILGTMENEYALTRPEFARIEELYFKIFDGNISQPFRRDSNRDSLFMLNPPLISNDPELMREFSGWLKFESNVYLEQNDDYMLPIKKAATELIALLKERYHLE